MVGAATGTDDLNHCTWWPDKIGSLDYSACCAAHDLAYASDGQRLAADLDLAQCVFDTTGSEILSIVMMTGVILFGWAFRKRKKKNVQQ